MTGATPMSPHPIPCPAGYYSNIGMSDVLGAKDGNGVATGC